MKTLFSIPIFCILVTVFVTVGVNSVKGGGNTPVVLREWAGYTGISDSAFKNPVLTDGDYSYTATVSFDSITGPNITVIKLNSMGQGVWKQIWSGAGFGRDQASGMAMDSNYLYVCGATYSSANNFDYVTMKLKKSDGHIEWTQTFNGAASNYDIATAIVVHDSSIYVTGVSFSTATAADYHTIKYRKDGALRWSADFDYNNLMDIPFALSYSEQDDSTLIVTGGSQSTLYDWDYQTVIYDYTGNIINQNRVSGSSAGFDRAQAVTTDDSGYIYITGATFENATDFDIKNVKLDKTGNLVWLRNYDSGNNDIGNDIIVDTTGQPYICGSAHGNGQDFFIAKLNRNNGGIDWSNTINIDGSGDDSARAMCFDSRGNIIVTGQVFNAAASNYDFLTIAYTSDGGELWRDYFDGPYHGDDNATDITSDTNGNIYVTGQVTTEEGIQTVTIKYRTDYFLEPPAVDTPSTAYLFYPNEGQLLDQNDSDVTDSVHYYTFHHSPQLFFGIGVMNMVWNHIDDDTATTDTLKRIDVTFLNSSNPTEAYPANEDTSSFLNYYLAQCPNGILDVHGNGSLVYTDVWPEIDVVYSSNNAGLKLTFVCDPGSYPQEIGLALNGQDGLSIDQNWYLKLHTSLGDYDFEKPRVYQIDDSNNVINLNWQLAWNIPQAGQANFIGWGSYDSGKPLIIEISKPIASSVLFQGISYSTYIGNQGSDEANATECNDYDLVVVGHTGSVTFPLAAGTNLSTSSAPWDAFIFKLDLVSQSFQWGVLYGGLLKDNASDVDFDKIGDIYVVGATVSPDLPQNSQPYSTITNGNVISQGSTPYTSVDNFIVKLDKTFGTISWANYIGSSGNEFFSSGAISIDRIGSEHIYVAGTTTGTDFPNLNFGGTNSYNQSANNGFNEGFILRFSKTGTLEWGSYFGSASYEMIKDIYAVHEIGSNLKLYIGGITNATAYDLVNPCLPPPSTNGDFPNCNSVSGSRFSKRAIDDVFIAEFNDNLELIWSTFIGGDHSEAMNQHCLTGYGNVVYLGITCKDATGTPTPPTCSGCYNQTSIANGANDGYIVRFDNETLSWSTFIGGGDGEDIGSVKTYQHNLFVTGISWTSNVASPPYCLVPAVGEFPLCNALAGYYFQNNYHSGNDAYIASFDDANVLSWCTLIGGNQIDIGKDICADVNHIYLVGTTKSYFVTSSNDDYPQWSLNNPGVYNQGVNAGSEDAFLTRFDNSVWISIDEKSEETNSVNIFPNPTLNKIKLESTRFSKEKIYYTIQDMYGKIILSDVLKDNHSQEINVSSFASGMFFITFNIGNDKFTRKFIKE